jgi:hypothetical protein
LSKTEAESRRLIFRWTALKGFTAIILFLIITVFFEFLLVYSFEMLGLIDNNTWTGAFWIPATNVSFNVTISPLLNLVPLSVLVVLVASWAYLTKHTALVPSRVGAAKRTLQPLRREVEKHRLKGLRKLSKRVSRSFQRFGHSVKARFQRIRGVSYLSRRLYFARAAVRSAVAVLAVFLSISLLLYIVVYPDLIAQLVLGLYKGNPSFLGFVRGIGDLTRGVGQALPPLGGLGAAINKALFGAAPGFRGSLARIGASLTVSVVDLSVVGKYVLSQNLAAWVAALVALIYGWYASSRRVKRR